MARVIFLLGLTCGLASADISVAEKDGDLVVASDEIEVLRYRMKVVPPPDGVDAAYTRSAFLHPVTTPNGVSITGIHPDDHYHHLGFWHAWVMTEWNGKEVDFWNLKKKTGGVRFGEVLDLGESHFTVQQEHYALDSDGNATVVLLEELTVRVALVDGAIEIDYDTTQTNVTEHVLKLPAYRYGGPIAYRGPAHWDKDNGQCLTSSGKTREDGHESRGNWVAYSGPAEEDSESAVSVAVFCHNENHDAPQRMRIWPEKTHNGAVFFNYVPIQETGMEILPDEEVSMRYRIVTKDEGINADDLEGRWARYVAAD